MAPGPSGSGVGLAPSPIQLGDVRVHTPVILAPMAGVTDQAFRRVCREFGEAPLRRHGDTGEIPDLLDQAVPHVDAPSGMYVAEMVTARALLEDNGRAWSMVRPDPSERVRSVQLYGTDPETLAAAAALLVDRELADHIDLNFGCPVPKVTRKGGGAAIPWKKDLFADIVRQVVGAVEAAGLRRGVNVPVTVKMRIGIDDDHTTALDAAQIAQANGIAAVGLHARTQEQYYSGSARWEWIARLKEQMKIPVFGNGDVFGADDALAMMTQTGCDAVIVGRGCQGRPWLFEDLTAATWGFEDRALPTLEEVSEALLGHARLSVEMSGDESRSMRELRKHVGWYLRGFSVGGSLRRNLNLVSTVAELEELLGTLDLQQTYPEAAQGSRGRAGSAKRPHLPHGWLDSRSLSGEEKMGLEEAEDGVSGG